MNDVGCVIAAGLLFVAGISVCKAASRRATVTSALKHLESNSHHDSEEQQCMHFLKRHMPARDQGVVAEQTLLEHVQLALRARNANQWAAAVPWEIFLNDVLPYRNLDEPIDDFNWRVLFWDKFSSTVAGASSLTDAAQTLNR